MKNIFNLLKNLFRKKDIVEDVKVYPSNFNYVELKKIGDYVFDKVKDEKLKYFYTNYFTIATILTYNSTDPSIYSMILRVVCSKDLERATSLFKKHCYKEIK